MNKSDFFRLAMKLEPLKPKRFQPQLFTSLKGYNKQKFLSDLMAGILVGVVALPLAIAFAIASGVSPEKGLYTAIIAGFIVSVLGGSNYQISGPTGAFIIISSNVVTQYGLEGLLVTTVMAGIMLFTMGALRLGIVIKYIPYPIMVGYMSGMAAIIFSTQMKDFFGLQITNIPSDFLGKWSLYLSNLDTINFFTLGIGLASVGIILLTPKFTKKIPGALIAILIMTPIVYLLKNYTDIDSISTIGDNFSISGEFPQQETALFSIELINNLFPSAFALAILGSIESLLSINIADGVTGEKSHSNTELVAQGTANIITPFFGGIPASGAMARTMTNVSNGAKTPVAGIVHSLFLLIIVLFLGNLASLIPMASLAAVLFVVSYNLSEWRSFISLLRNSKSDVVVLLTTFFLTLIFDITIAIEVGILLSIFLFMKRVTDSTHINVSINELEMDSDIEAAPEEEKITLPKGVEVYEIDGPFFFGLANKFEESMRSIEREKPKVRIIRMNRVPFMDSTGLHNLEGLCIKSQKEKIHIILSGVNESVKSSLQKSRFPMLIGETNICPTLHSALFRAEELLETENKRTNK